MKKLVIIDTFNFLHRAYHALPNTLTDKNGEPTNAVYGVTSMLISLFDQIKPDYVLAALDDVEPTMRHEEFTGYKAHRRPMEDDLSSQIPKVFEVLDAFGIKRISLAGYEADDIIGTMAENYYCRSCDTEVSDNVSKSRGLLQGEDAEGDKNELNEDLEIIIVSNDRDLWQLVKDNVLVMNPAKQGLAEWIGPKEVMAKYGFEPGQLIDYKALRGDPSDNIPGVYGIGDKTARKLIDEYNNLGNIYEHIEEISPESLKKKLSENYEEAVMSKNLATIITDAPIDISLEDCKFKDINKVWVKEVLEKYNFKSLIRRLGITGERGAKGSNKSEPPEGQLSLL